MKFDLISTMKDSLAETFYPRGWDLEKMKSIFSLAPEEMLVRQDFWNPEFEPVFVEDQEEWFIKVGHDMAKAIADARKEGREIALVLPAGPATQYRYCAYFLKEWDVKCDHVYGFNMDDLSDENGDVLHFFDRVMEEYLYDPLGAYTVPESHRNYATKENLPTYPEKIAEIKKRGGTTMLISGIGRCFHMAMNDPHWAEDFESEEDFLKEDYRIAGKVHPMTVEQNSLTTFRGDFTRFTPYSNTVSTGFMIRCDRMSGGCRAWYDDDITWQAAGAWVALRYGPDMWVPCSYLPTMKGRFYIVKELAGIRGPYYPVEA